MDGIDFGAFGALRPEERVDQMNYYLLYTTSRAVGEDFHGEIFRPVRHAVPLQADTLETAAQEAELRMQEIAAMDKKAGDFQLIQQTVLVAYQT